MKIVLLLGLGCVICGTAQAQVRCPPYCAATPITRVPLGSAIASLFYPCRAGSDDPLPLARPLRPYGAAILFGEAVWDRRRPG